ncbi:MAG: DNA repair exonuclease [Gemmatimonadota bacterium]|jgi:DNA repair exonuclease SbcCD nuclease subunit
MSRSRTVRVLLFADSHLGFDLPLDPRVERRRRGHDFLANHEGAVAYAREAKVDLIVHGGDVFDRPRVPPSLVYQAFRPLLEAAAGGIPVLVVPGNHERSRIPHRRFARHGKLHVFERPETVVLRVRGVRVALAGFPYVRRGIRRGFSEVVRTTGWRDEAADLRVLCMHHCVEGARVGPGDFTFRDAPDVVRGRDLPSGVAAVLSGHIHRPQVLERDLAGRDLPAPVVYPGSVERTSFAEIDEPKGFRLLDLEPTAGGGRLVRDRFVPLPARPMVVREVRPAEGDGMRWTPRDLETRITAVVAGAPRDAVLRVRVHGHVPAEARAVVAASRLRRIAPPGMNLEVLLEEHRSRRRRPARRSSRPRSKPPSLFHRME